MILRINQLPVARVDASAWSGAAGPFRGPLAHAWPADALAFEVLILPHDEQRRPLTDAFRQGQMRQLIPHAVAALREPGEEVVARLDGPPAPAELLPALRHLTDAGGATRFALSNMARLDGAAGESVGSIRINVSDAALAALCADAALGLERGVRLRVFAVPAGRVNSLLVIDAANDVRWAGVLDEAGFVLNAGREMRGLYVVTRRLDAAGLKSRLTRRLAEAVGATAGAVPAAGR